MVWFVEIICLSMLPSTLFLLCSSFYRPEYNYLEYVFCHQTKSSSFLLLELLSWLSKLLIETLVCIRKFHCMLDLTAYMFFLTNISILYLVSLNCRGAALHKKYFYGSVTLLPLTSVLAVRTSFWPQYQLHSFITRCGCFTGYFY